MFHKREQLLLMLRFTTFSLWLIFTTLIVPDFQPGGRYLILLCAFLSAVGSGFIRRWTKRFGCRVRGIIGGLGLLPAWLVVKLIYPGVQFNLPGLFLTYLGWAVIEMLLPNRIHPTTQMKTDGGTQE